MSNAMEKRPNLKEHYKEVNWLMLTPALAAFMLPAARFLTRKYYAERAGLTTKVVLGLILAFSAHGFWMMSMYALNFVGLFSSSRKSTRCSSNNRS